MIVGLCGVAESGKDAVANVLVDKFAFSNAKFSQGIKDALYELDPYVMVPTTYRVQQVVNKWGWDEAKKLFPEVRVLLQRMGTEVGRELWGENFWVDKAMWSMPHGNVVFSDARFPSEHRAVRGVGGVVWEVVRPGVNPVNQHASDNAWEGADFEYRLDNDGTLEDLVEKVQKGLAYCWPSENPLQVVG